MKNINLADTLRAARSKRANEIIDARDERASKSNYACIFDAGETIVIDHVGHFNDGVIEYDAIFTDDGRRLPLSWILNSPFSRANLIINGEATGLCLDRGVFEEKTLKSIATLDARERFSKFVNSTLTYDEKVARIEHCLSHGATLNYLGNALHSFVNSRGNTQLQEFHLIEIPEIPYIK